MLDYIHLLIDSLFGSTEYFIKLYIFKDTPLFIISFTCILFLVVGYEFITRSYNVYVNKHLFQEFSRYLQNIGLVLFAYLSWLLIMISLSDFKSGNLMFDTFLGYLVNLSVVECFFVFLFSFVTAWACLPPLKRQLTQLNFSKIQVFGTYIIFLASIFLIISHIIEVDVYLSLLASNYLFILCQFLLAPILGLIVMDICHDILSKFMKKKTYINMISRNIFIIVTAAIFIIGINNSSFVNLTITGLLASIIVVLGIQIGLLLRERIPAILISHKIKTPYDKLLANFICLIIIFQFIAGALTLSSVEYYTGLENILSAFTHIAIFTVAAMVVHKYLIEDVTKHKIDSTLSIYFGRVIIAVLALICIILVMEDLKVDTRPLLGIIFAGGLAIALALQSSLSNFAAGLWIVLFKPFKIKDNVAFKQQIGFIVDIDFLFTRLQLYNGSIIVIPNSEILSNVVQNLSCSNIYRVRTEICVSYKADLAKVIEVFTKILEKMPHSGLGKKNNYSNSVIAALKHQIWIAGFEDSGILVRVSYWIDSPAFEVSFTNAFRESVATQFQKEMIEIPFNRMDVHILKDGSD